MKTDHTSNKVGFQSSEYRKKGLTDKGASCSGAAERYLERIQSADWLASG